MATVKGNSATIRGSRKTKAELKTSTKSASNRTKGTFEDLDDTAPMRSRPCLTKWGGPRHNAALAECAAVEERCGDTISSHMAMLTSSPMYKLLVDEYRTALAKSDGLESDWYLTLFGSRLFYAGVIAGRGEKSQRDECGDLILDAPWRAEPKDVAINPA